MTTPFARVTAWRADRAERRRVRTQEPYAHARYMAHPAAGTTTAYWLLNDVDTRGLGAGIDDVIARQASMLPDLADRWLSWHCWHEPFDPLVYRAGLDAEYPNADPAYLESMVAGAAHPSLDQAWWRCVLGVQIASHAVAREDLPLCEPGAPLSGQQSAFAEMQATMRVLDDALAGYGRPLTAAQIEQLHREFTRMGLPGDADVLPSADVAQPAVAMSTLHDGRRVDQHVAMMRVDTAPDGFDSLAQRPWLSWFGSRPGSTYVVAQGVVVAPADLRKSAQLRLRENRSHERSSHEAGFDTRPEVDDGIERAREYQRELRAQDRVDSYRVQAVVKVALPRSTQEEVAAAVRALRKDADDEAHCTVTHNLGQYADWQSMEPGRTFTLDGHVTQATVRTWAAAVPNSSGRAGAPAGQLFGAIEDSHEVLNVDWWEGPRAKTRKGQVEGSGLHLLVGGLGVGKSTVAVGAAHHCVKVGRRCVINDPSPFSAMARLTKVPGVDGRELPLTTQAPPGALMPHLLIPDPAQVDGVTDAEHAGALRAARAERVAFAIDTTKACAWELSDDADAMRAIVAACNEVGGAYGTQSQQILTALDQEGSAGKRVARHLRSKRESLEGTLVFPHGDVDPDRLMALVSSAALTVITMPGLEPPEGPAEDWSVGMRQSVPILLGASRLSGLSMWADTDPKMQIDDELGITLSGASAMATHMRRTAYTSRKSNTAALWLAQTPTAYERLGDDLITSLVWAIMCGRVTGDNAAVMAALMRLAADEAAELEHLGTGDFVIRVQDQVTVAHHDTGWWSPDVRRASLTTPAKEAPVITTLWGERAS